MNASEFSWQQYTEMNQKSADVLLLESLSHSCQTLVHHAADRNKLFVLIAAGEQLDGGWRSMDIFCDVCGVLISFHTSNFNHDAETVLLHGRLGSGVASSSRSTELSALPTGNMMPGYYTHISLEMLDLTFYSPPKH